MLKAFSNKSIAAKARAMYGQRLTPADYEELMKKRSVGDVAAYLRDNTHYREVLRDVDSAAIHRGQLENFLRSLRFLQYQRLIAYDHGQQEFYRYLYLQSELQQIIALLRYLSGRGQGQASGQYDFHYDRHLEGHTSFDLQKLVALDSYQGLADFLADTPYGGIIRDFPPDPSGQIDLRGFEQALSTYYYGHLLEVARREFYGAARKAVREMILRQVDTENIIQVYRLKRFFHGDPQFIRESLQPFPTASHDLLERMIAAGSVAELHGILAEAGLIQQKADEDSGFIENMMLRLRYRWSKQDLRVSPHPPVVLYAYMTQLEIELDDVINIIESVRYGLPANEMRSLLIEA